MTKLFVPSGWHLMQQIKAAEAKFEAARKAALTDRAEQAMTHNRRVIGEQRAADCRRHMYVGDTK